jgi:hypothetical protein
VTPRIRDGRHYEPKTITALRQEFLDWEVWRGINNRFYAGPKPVRRAEPAVSGEDLGDLRDKIIVWIRTHPS